jgi:hypothetical protein
MHTDTVSATPSGTEMTAQSGPVSATQSVALVTAHSTAIVTSVYQTPNGENSTPVNVAKTGQVMTVAHGEDLASTPVTPVAVMKPVTVLSVLRTHTTTHMITEPVSVTITGSTMAVSTTWDHVTQSVTDVLVQIAVTVSTVYITLTKLLTHTPVKTIVSVMTGGQETIAPSTRDGVTTNVTVAGDHVPATVTHALTTPTSTTTDTASVTKTGKANAAASTSDNVTATVNKNSAATDQETNSVLNVP